jgi:acyl carrier protein
MRQHIHQTVVNVLGLSTDTVLSDDQGFFNLGMDSIMAIDLKNKLQSELGNVYALSATLAFDQSNIAAIVLYYEKNVLPALAIEIVNIIDESQEKEKKFAEQLQKEKVQKAHIEEDEIAKRLREKFQKSKKG